ncbi:S9 family peptidase [Tepidiforma sp.]|uniref:S9 family peptidase n=1 Tax=Tepidiforma sp. TaxID=2682230 RepID=UPI002ADE0AF4|nr:S9 family peptidase [Tepidiforma sp.]
MHRQHRMYGLWPSPITPSALAVSLRLAEPAWDTDGRTLAWVEGRSDRGVIVAQHEGEPATRDLTPDLSVRAFIGYGGGDFTISRGTLYFVGQADQRIYRQDLAGGRPRPITPAFGAASTPTVSPDGRWLAYVHSVDDVDCIAVVDTEGRNWPRRLATGRDFYMQPAWHPSGRQLAWIEWDHPSMPWDATDLRLADLDTSGELPAVASSRIIAGGPETSIFQPAFSPDGAALYFVSDETGWGHLYRYDLSTGALRQLTSGEAEHGTPAWMHGMRTFAVLDSGTVIAVSSRAGFHALVAVDPDGAVRDLAHLHPGYTALANPAARPGSAQVALVASGGQQPPRVIVVDTADPFPAPSVRRRADAEIVPPSALSAPQPVTWTSFDGEPAHGLYYPPASEGFQSEGAPPLIVLVHGGPTSQAIASWNSQAQYFATRGYAVLIPNYRGSTGYGRAYMLKLRHNWGIYDVQDARTGAEDLARRGLADPTRLVIMGGSAGGFTVLQSLVEHPGFYRAAICMFGVANQFTLAADTHKFEARYLDSLLGPLPEAAAIYRERSPIFHADRIRDPIAVFQGEIDRVVPREQSDTIVASLRARGVPHEYHVYPGEGHGWRKSETIEHFYRAVESFLKTHVLYA